jgi:hypothetical protein
VTKAGIDFGTTKSGIAIATREGAEVVPLDPATPANPALLETWALPSRVGVNYESHGSRPNFTVGSLVDSALSTSKVKSNGLYAPKMLKLKLGETSGFPPEDQQALSEMCPKGCDLVIPEGLVSVLLYKLKRYANIHCRKHGRGKISSAVIGVPADFSYLKRKSLLCAAHLAKLGEVVLLPEPLAAMLSLREHLRVSHRVMVIDFGGGSCNYAIFSLEEKDAVKLVYANAVPIGGEHITDALFNEIIPHESHSFSQRWLLRRSVERAKCSFAWPPISPEVSAATQPEAPDSESYYDPDNPPKSGDYIQIDWPYNVLDEDDFDHEEITYERFDQIVREKVTEVREWIKKDLPPLIEDVEKVVFIGESRRLYCFRDIFWEDWLKEEAGKHLGKEAEPYNLPRHEGSPQIDDSSQAVVKGCTQFCAALHLPRFLPNRLPYQLKNPKQITLELRDEYGHDLSRSGIRENDQVVEESTELPIRRTLSFQLHQQVRKFRIEFWCKGETANTPIEVYVVEPKPMSRFKSIPSGTYVWITYEVRIDRIIEILDCTARMKPTSWFPLVLKKLRGRDGERPLAFSIPLVWKSKLSFFDDDAGDIESNRTFYKLP